MQIGTGVSYEAHRHLGQDGQTPQRQQRTQSLAPLRSLLPLLAALLIIPTPAISVSASASTDAKLLLAFRDGFDNGRAILSNWTGDNPCSGWAGIVCYAEGRVVQMNLAEFGLKGTIPSVPLPERLERLDLSYNQLSGGLPGQNLPRTLVNLVLSGSQLSGELMPKWLAALPPGLGELDLADNSFSGTLSAEWQLPEGLASLRLGHNKIGGRIDAAWALPPRLEGLLMSDNFLEGAIPEDWVLPDSLFWLGLSGNQLNGTIPFGLTWPSSLASLYLGQNRLTGSIVPDWGLPAKHDFNELDLSANDLTGPIPPLTLSADLEMLRLDQNQLSSLPEAWELPPLVQVDLSENRLAGTIPSWTVQQAASGSGSSEAKSATVYLQPGNPGLCGPVPTNLPYTVAAMGMGDKPVPLTSLAPCKSPSPSASPSSASPPSTSPPSTSPSTTSPPTTSSPAPPPGSSGPLTTSPSSPAPAPPSSPAPEDSGSSGTAAIAGAVAGAICGVVLAGLLAWWCWRWRQAGAPGRPSGLAGSEQINGQGDVEGGGRGIQPYSNKWPRIKDSAASSNPPSLPPTPLLGSCNGGASDAAPGAAHSQQEPAVGTLGTLPAGPPPRLVAGAAEEEEEQEPSAEADPALLAHDELLSSIVSQLGPVPSPSQKQLQPQPQPSFPASLVEMWVIDFRELTLLRQIGEGSFGKVYLGTWHETQVAVKLLLGPAASLAASPNMAAEALVSLSNPMLAALREEAAMMARLRHPNVLSLLAVSMVPPTLVSEYCPRGSLYDVLREAKSSPALAKKLTWQRRLRMAMDAATGLLYLHAHQPPLLHRDVKSLNFLVKRSWSVKVADFNLSKIIEAADPELGPAGGSTMIATNPRWLAPEVLDGKKHSFASDVFSYGNVLWELASWELPWSGPDSPVDATNTWQVAKFVVEGGRLEFPDAQQVRGGAFPGYEAYVRLAQRCWAQEPGERPGFGEVVAELRRLLATAGLREYKGEGGSAGWEEGN